MKNDQAPWKLFGQKRESLYAVKVAGPGQEPTRTRPPSTHMRSSFFLKRSL